MGNAGVDLFTTDYDMRSPLHLAAANGNLEIINFIIEWCPVDKVKRQELLSTKDRWGATALNEANHNGHRDCAKSLRNAGSFLGKSKHLDATRR